LKKYYYKNHNKKIISEIFNSTIFIEKSNLSINYKNNKISLNNI